MNNCKHGNCNQHTDYTFCYFHYKEMENARKYKTLENAPSGVWICEWCVEHVDKPTKKDWEQLDKEMERERAYE